MDFLIPTIETFSNEEIEELLVQARCGSVTGSCYGGGTCGIGVCG